MKTAFEQVYGAPYLARMIFAEVGAKPADDLFLRVEYDGAIAASGSAADGQPPRFSVISGTARATELMEELLRRDHDSNCTLKAALKVALDAWSAGSMLATDDEVKEISSHEALLKHRQEKLRSATVEACVLERSGENAIRYRQIAGEELKELSAT